VAIVLGVLFANLSPVHASLEPGLRFASKRVLRVGVVLLGFQLALDDIVGLGWAMLIVVVAVVAIGIGGGLIIGRVLGLRPVQSLLIACGFSICGAAAVAAVEGAVDADEEDVASAVGLVVLYGTLMIGVVPLLLGAMRLPAHEQGLVAGASIHEVAQVVAAGGVIGGGALTVAVVVKLARVLMLAPVILAIGLVRRRGGEPTRGSRPPLVPLFVVGFVGAAVIRTVGHLDPIFLRGVGALQTVCLAAAMFALGCGVRLTLMRRMGARPVVLGALGSALVLAVSTAGVLLVA
jgi:uncharacterized integral membrane protein (TIGR00698 family)